MKLNVIPTIIAITVSFLIAYGLYSFSVSGNKLLLSLGGFVFLAATLVYSIAVDFEQSRATTNVRVVSGIFFVLALVSNIIFSFFNFSPPSYIITNGVLLLTYFLIVYSIYKAKQ